MTQRPVNSSNSSNSSNSTNRVLELIPKGFTAAEPLARTDATIFKLEMVDNMGKEYVVKFSVRNFYVGQMHQAIKRLVPLKRIKP